MDLILGALIIGIVQVIVGIVTAISAKRVAAASDVDILADVTIGKATVKIDKTDIVAVAFSIFIFWAVANAGLDARDGVTAFVTILTGTGVKEMIEAFYPTTK